ncbi:vegetative cell wall protein gp1-like [Abrus precatorius]|uniref:Vegetative cell wall protein gp1-like n=1 Tax=Abrus precatorius TaxID=3816 RepID=A0A8B8MK00_ABRPR|nr:vegetative cell wall protein gp1-like [Abrus precatorius]
MRVSDDLNWRKYGSTASDDLGDELRGERGLNIQSNDTPSHSDYLLADIFVPLPSEKSIIIHPPSPNQTPPFEPSKTLDKGKAPISLDPAPTSCPSSSSAPEWKDVEIVESSIWPVPHYSLRIPVLSTSESGPSTRCPSPPPLPISRSPPPTIGWIDNNPDDLSPSLRPQPAADSPDSDGMESNPSKDSLH